MAPPTMEKQRGVSEDSADEEFNSSSEAMESQPIAKKKKSKKSKKSKSKSSALDQLPVGGDTVNNAVGGVTGALGGVTGALGGGQQESGGGGGGKSDTLRLRLDLNLDIEIQLKARIHGDLELALLN